MAYKGGSWRNSFGKTGYAPAEMTGAPVARHSEIDALSLGLLKFGVLLGIAAAAPIGPVNVEIARRTLRRGFSAGFALGCGAVSVDVFYAILSSQGVKRLVIDRPLVMQTLGYAGAAMLLWLGGMSLRAAWRATKVDPLAEAESHPAAPSRACRGRRRRKSSAGHGLVLRLLAPAPPAPRRTRTPA
jgi:threonine/homoserine/homoserine lactone efflux protein